MPREAAVGRVEPVISVLIVTWNGWPLLERCLASLRAEERAGAPIETVVVDNASTDGTQDRLAEQAPDVRLLSLDRNMGFAAANNAGVPLCSGRLVFLLNNDTTVCAGAFAALLDAERAFPGFHVFVPEMLRMHEPSRVDNRGIYLDRTGHLRQLDSGAPAAEARATVEVFGASGGAALIRRDVIERCGLFDESLGSYVEDGDFACRARSAGFRALYIPGARILHEGSATGNRLPDRKLHLIQRNMLVVHRRWFPFRPWRGHSWLGLAYESGQVARSLLRRQGRVTLRAKLEAVRRPARAGASRTGRRRLAAWLGVRARSLS